MLFSTSLLVTLAASAAAIDIRMRRDSTDCGWGGGGWVACNNANPDFCCWTGEGVQTLWIAAIPNGWNIEGKLWYDTACRNRSPTLQGGGQSGSNVCERGGGNDIRGGSYGFRNRKRDANASNGCQPADTFVLGDGITQYNITGLPNAAINELVSTALPSV
jgi:hypothetical protein